MNKFYSRAKIYFEHAKSDYTKIDIDTCYLDSCCFLLQQSLEFLIKGAVDLLELDCSENYDIRTNLNILDQRHIDIPLLKEINRNINMLYIWKNDSRCKESFTAAVKDIEEVMAIVKSLFEYVEAHMKKRELTEIEFPSHKLSDT